MGGPATGGSEEIRLHAVLVLDVRARMRRPRIPTEFSAGCNAPAVVLVVCREVYVQHKVPSRR